MSPSQAREFIARYPQAKSFVKASHLEELSPLFEVHVEALEVTKDEFHDLQGSYAPKKETIDKFAQAAGVSFNCLAETTRKEGEACYVGRSQATIMGPDGKMVFGDVCEYEFDVDIRLEELKLKGKNEWVNGQKTTRKYTELELAQERIQLFKVARQRANTGARSRATLSILGMQTGFKGLFTRDDGPNAKRTFLFSRVIVNAKNELVMNRMLDSIGGNAAALFGPTPVAQIASPQAHQPEAAGFRNVTESSAPTAAADDFGDEGFDDLSGAAPASSKLAELTEAIAEWAECGDPRIAGRARRILDRGEQSVEVLELSLKILQYLGSGNSRGTKTCADALDLPKPDLIVLRDVVSKLPAQGAA